MFKYFLILLTLTSSLVLYSNAADKSPEALGQDFFDLALRRPVVKLNFERFRKFVSTKQRDYDVIVMMTALNPGRSCSICRAANEEYAVAAQSYRLSPNFETKKLFFAMVDYDDGSDVFKSLSINSAPGFLFFGAKDNSQKPTELNIQRMGFDAEVIARWAAEKTGLSFKIIRPPNFSGPIIIAILSVVTGAVLYASRNSLHMIFNRNFFAISSVVIVLFMTSGQMWNQIRGAPFKQRAGNGESVYIHQSSSAQFGFESYYIMALNAGIGFSIVLMIDSMRVNSKLDGKNRRYYALFGLATMAVLYSLLLATVRYKSYGYPYRLLL